MHAGAGAIEVVGGVKEMEVGGGKRRAKPALKFQTWGTGAIIALLLSKMDEPPQNLHLLSHDGVGMPGQVNLINKTICSLQWYLSIGRHNMDFMDY